MVIVKNVMKKFVHYPKKLLNVLKWMVLDNDLVERVKTDPYFTPIVNKLDVLLDAKTFIGRAPEQVHKMFLICHFFLLSFRFMNSFHVKSNQH